MKYKQILSKHQPVETGDFFVLYKVKNFSYLIYSPEISRVSCIEFVHFNEITPEELGILIDENVEEKIEEEFSFSETCSKEKVLTYLNDIKYYDDKTGYYERYVGKNSGYILLDGRGKFGNMYEIRDDGSSLLYDNPLCLRSNVVESGSVFICFNPVAYKRLLSEESIKAGYSLYLFPVADISLLEMIDKSKSINILVDTDYLKTLYSIIYFFNKRDSDNKRQIEIFENDKVLTLQFSGEHAIEDILNLISKAERKVKEFSKGDSLRVFYELKIINEKYFINFVNSDMLIKCFCFALILFYKRFNINLVL